jgi:hypothetical protein
VPYDIEYDLQNLTALDWTEHVNTSGTGGSFLKARAKTARHTTYYKLSCFSVDRGIYGHESINEIVAARLARLMGLRNASYRLVHALVEIQGECYETWLSESPSFRKPGEKKLALDTYYALMREPGESRHDFVSRMGWKPYIDRLFAFDYVIANRDRHGANIEVLRSQDGTVRLAPVFDSGLSLLFSTYGDPAAIAAFDPRADIMANNWLGSHSLEKNLELIDQPLAVNRLDEKDLASITSGLEATAPRGLIQAMDETIRARWNILCKTIDMKGSDVS